MLDTTKPRLDAYEKVTGRAKYTDDLSFPGMLYAATIHSPHPNAEILAVNAAPALAVNGVVGVYLAQDCRGSIGDAQDKPVLAEHFVRCIGDGVALVAAESEQIARAAAELVEVRYRQLPAVLDLREAVMPDAPLVHPEAESNVFYVHQVEKGDIAEGFAAADVIVEHTYTTPRYHHGAIEPDAVITAPQPDGRLAVYCCSKGAFAVRDAVAKITALPPEQIHLIHATLGGTFGGKQVDTIVLAGRSAIVTQHTGRPCKIVWSREETMAEGSKRHPFVVTYKIGAKRDGRLVAMQVTGLADGGAYKSKSAGVVRRAAVECSGPYCIPHVSIDLKGVFTNQVYCDAVRGFGSPQVYFGLESTMDVLAQRLGIEPLELRKRNALRDGDVFATGQTMHHVGILPCLHKLEEMFPCKPLSRMVKNGRAYGRGIACQIRGESHGSGAKDLCGVDLLAAADGSITLNTGITEMGQGTHTGLALVACNLLELSWSRFRAGNVDTDIVPFATPTTASRGTISGANATYLAVEDLLANLKTAIAKTLCISTGSILYRDGRFYHHNGSEQIDFDAAVRLALDMGIEPMGCGRWIAPSTDWDPEAKRGNAFYSYSYGAAGAEVSIDLVTGKLEVENLTCLHDAGHIVNYAGAKGQIEGGLVMALGHSTSEELGLSGGRVTTQNFDSYLMPTSLDTHTLIGRPVALVPNDTPMGVHGVAEGSTVLPAAAIANAVADALGVRIFDLPLDLERVRKAIEQSRTISGEEDAQ